MLWSNDILNEIILIVIISTCVMGDNAFVEITSAKFQKDALRIHNYYRGLHGITALTHNKKLEDFARKRAKEIAKKDGTNFNHPDDLEYGENLAWNSIKNIDCQIPLKLWYDEWQKPGYNFKKPNINSKNGHFTQMVWKGTKKMGCGQAVSKGKKGGTYTVCNYEPPGNYINEEKENVVAAKKKDTTPSPSKKSASPATRTKAKKTVPKPAPKSAHKSVPKSASKSATKPAKKLKATKAPKKSSKTKAKSKYSFKKSLKYYSNRLRGIDDDDQGDTDDQGDNQDEGVSHAIIRRRQLK